MTQDFWGPIFSKLQENCELLELMLEDSDDKTIISFIKEDPALLKGCQKFIKNKKLIQEQRQKLIEQFRLFLPNKSQLRKIIFETWIKKNSATLSFPTIEIDKDSISKLASGVYGSPLKIQILSFIDPRDAAKPVYASFISNSHKTEKLLENLEKAQKDCQNWKNKFSNQEINFENLKKQLKEAKKELEKKSNQLNSLEKKYTDRITAQNAEQKNIEELEAEITSLKSKNDFLLKENKQLAATVKKNKEALNRPTEPDPVLQTKIAKLQQIIDNRNKSISKLTDELTQLKSANDLQLDKDRQISNLQEMLEKEKSNSNLKIIIGFISNRIKLPNGKNRWIFSSLSGENYFLKPRLALNADLSERELALAKINENDEIEFLSSLETEEKLTIFGTMEQSSDGPAYVTTRHNKYKIADSTSTYPENSLIRAVLLPEIASREAGVYSVEPIVINQTKKQSTEKLHLSKLGSKLDLIGFNKDQFLKILKNKKIKFEVQKGKITFAHTAFLQKNHLRSLLDINKVCKRNECLQAAQERFDFFQQIKEHELCDICSKPLLQDQQNLDFSGKSIIIFGGDRVGKNYKTYLEQHNLKVTWESGFGHATSFKNGFGKVDAIVLILKQLSHTVLREILPLAAEYKTPVVYCSKRGLTGTLETLAKFYKI